MPRNAVNVKSDEIIELPRVSASSLLVETLVDALDELSKDIVINDVLVHSLSLEIVSMNVVLRETVKVNVRIDEESELLEMEICSLSDETIV